MLLLQGLLKVTHTSSHPARLLWRGIFSPTCEETWKKDTRRGRVGEENGEKLRGIRAGKERSGGGAGGRAGRRRRRPGWPRPRPASALRPLEPSVPAPREPSVPAPSAPSTPFPLSPRPLLLLLLPPRWMAAAESELAALRVSDLPWGPAGRRGSPSPGRASSGFTRKCEAGEEAVGGAARHPTPQASPPPVRRPAGASAPAAAPAVPRAQGPHWLGPTRLPSAPQLRGGCPAPRSALKRKKTQAAKNLSSFLGVGEEGGTGVHPNKPRLRSQPQLPGHQPPSSIPPGASASPAPDSHFFSWLLLLVQLLSPPPSPAP